MTKSRVLGILPARGGSKGIPGKNLRPLLGRPLIAWSATALAQAVEVEKKICSTDDLSIAKVAEACGLEVPWTRPAELAQDGTLVVDVVAHALKAVLEESGVSYTHVALVQATSPTVTAKDINAAICLCLEKNADTVITGFSAGHRHPAIMYEIKDDCSVQWVLGQQQRMARRQDLPPVFVRTGLVYVMKADVVLNYGSIYGNKVVSLIIPENRAVTIDDESDFKLAELLLKGGN